ncbi:MAG: hypothetical protein ACRDJU_03220 [Actinomycetota bacterium]
MSRHLRRHPGRAVLRRVQDEPGAVPERDRTHIAACVVCQRRQEVDAAAAAVASSVLAEGARVQVDPLPALRQLRATETSVVPPKPRALDQVRDRIERTRRRTLRVGAVSTVVVLAMGTLVATGVAGNLVNILQPESFAPVQVNLESFTTLPDLSGYGNVHVLETPRVTETGSQASAASFSGLDLLAPGKLPSSVKGPTTYLAATAGAASFTFNTDTASGTAGKLHKALPALPANLNGSTLTLQGGPAVVELTGSQSLGDLAGLVPGGLGSLGLQHSSAKGEKVKPTLKSPAGAPTGTATEGGSGNKLKDLLGGVSSVPELAIVQMKAPALSSNGPSLADYENALLSMPGVPASLSAQIKALGNPSTTLPIPIPTSLASSSAVNINGAPGLLIGDSTGIASAVIWESHGSMYAVVGALSSSQVVAIARSLH